MFALLVVAFATLCATEVATRIVDPLGRPVADVAVDVYWLHSLSKDDVREVGLVTLKSDRNGLVSGTYDETSVPRDEDIWVKLSKDGYDGYSTPGLQLEFVLEREFGVVDLHRIASLEGDAQVNELREFLAGRFQYSAPSPHELVFAQEDKFRPGLRALVGDPKVGLAAGGLLAFIGIPEDTRLFIDHAPSPHKKLFENRWAHGIVCALLEPTTEREWAFLRNCALNKYDDRWVDAGAIRSLKLIASPRSKEVLKEVRARNEGRASSIDEAIKYIESSPAALADKDLTTAARKVAQAIKIGEWQGNKPPQYNESKDKALVACEFIAGSDLLVHTATFHHVDGSWRLRGVRETFQALLGRAPETSAKPDKTR